MQLHSLTNYSKGISNVIITPVVLQTIDGCKLIECHGLWDTGATASVITTSVVTALELKATGITNMQGVNEIKQSNLYYLTVILNNDKIRLNLRVSECPKISNIDSIGILIGMDIISKGDFAITNYQGKTIMSFRVPSFQVIDFVKGTKQNTPVVKTAIPSRNSPCPCGSGKKYKHCCGKTK